MLVGYYRSKEHLNWILQNRLYNVRLGKRRGALRGVELQIIPSRIVLYGSEHGASSLRIFTVNQSEVMFADKHKMEQLNYPAGKNGIGEAYKLFSLGAEISNSDARIKNHKQIDIAKLKQSTARPYDDFAPIFVRY